MNKNRLSRVDHRIGVLTQLEVRYDVQQRPTYFNIQHLSLHTNNLSDLPSTLSQLTKLSEANLDYNKFLSIPTVVFALTNMKVPPVHNL